MPQIKHRTALETLREELRRVQTAQIHCVTEEGFVRTNLRYEYRELVKRGREIRASIEYLETV